MATGAFSEIVRRNQGMVAVTVKGMLEILLMLKMLGRMFLLSAQIIAGFQRFKTSGLYSENS